MLGKSFGLGWKHIYLVRQFVREIFSSIKVQSWGFIGVEMHGTLGCFDVVIHVLSCDHSSLLMVEWKDTDVPGCPHTYVTFWLSLLIMLS